jgi:hypothetical protein
MNAFISFMATSWANILFFLVVLLMIFHKPIKRFYHKHYGGLKKKTVKTEPIPTFLTQSPLKINETTTLENLSEKIREMVTELKAMEEGGLAIEREEEEFSINFARKSAEFRLRKNQLGMRYHALLNQIKMYEKIRDEQDKLEHQLRKSQDGKVEKE